MSERKGTKALELWCKRLIKNCSDIQIENMTTSWRNGIAFCALVHHFRPDLVDLSSLKPENIYENNQLAFSIAEKHLGIPALLDPEDMVENEVPDRLSILTYLSQFYQRLGHTVHTKVHENETKLTSSSSPAATQSNTPIKFGKTNLDKCAACGHSVYLAQRLIVSHKLYHRRCFRCSKCSGHLNPKNYELTEGSDFFCESCKNETKLSKFLNNNDDQMGMLAFSDNLNKLNIDTQNEEPIIVKPKSRPQSILDKISNFENLEKNKSFENKIVNLSSKTDFNSKYKELGTLNIVKNPSEVENEPVNKPHTEAESEQSPESKIFNVENEHLSYKHFPLKEYKSNINKFNFLQTQLSGDVSDIGNTLGNCEITDMKPNKEEEKEGSNNTIDGIDTICNIDGNDCKGVLKEESNITDDSRIAINYSTSNLDCPSSGICVPSEEQVSICVPPRRKKLIPALGKKSTNVNVNNVSVHETSSKKYPDHLNPFSDDDDEEVNEPRESSTTASTNPFGSSDEEDDDVPPIHPPKIIINQPESPTKRLISTYNPFWSDGEEPTSDEETHDGSSTMYKSSMTTSTPNLQTSTPRRRKPKAPPPPPALAGADAPHRPSTSMDDVASISSVSSYNSTVHSDQKSYGKVTPMLKKKRAAPTPPDSLSTVSGCGGSLEAGVDAAAARSSVSDGGKRVKGPAPGLPLPERREVKLQLSPEQLQVQLDLLETQQLGLERQGVLIEQMIRDKCEGDEPSSVPQEEVEDLVIQLCELVNEKNDLFRKQTELMYIRRQQRLEQEQADIEHEIRVIQSRPAVNRIDADKAREEQLVSRLVEIVRLRDELVQQIDAERRRERQEDLAIAASIASKRAQRNSESNSSSMKSVEVVATPKKNKVKDKVKKQLKKAKHTLISKKKDDSNDRKEDKSEKEKKSK